MADRLTPSSLPTTRDGLALLWAAARRDLPAMAAIVTTTDPSALAGVLVDVCLAQGAALAGSPEEYTAALERSLRDLPAH